MCLRITVLPLTIPRTAHLDLDDRELFLAAGTTSTEQATLARALLGDAGAPQTTAQAVTCVCGDMLTMPGERMAG